jgi:NADPH-dependent ferric siderophore reductase
MSKSKKKKHEDAGGKKKKKMRPAQIAAIERIGDQFRLIDIVANGCRGVNWQPGTKLKIGIGDSETRTYTPIAIDGQSGQVRILAYIHGHSLASQWAAAVAVGDKTYTSAPGSSLNLDELSSSVVFFGDETSFGSAKSLQFYLGADSSAYCVFEVRQPQQAAAVAERLDLANVTLVEICEDGSHLGEVARLLQKAMADLSTSHLLLTGNGRSIQTVRAALHANNIAKIEYLVKAYWTPKKTLKD